MSKEQEALDDFIKDYLFLCEKLCTNKQEKMLLDSNSPYNILKTYLEAIDNANSSELIKKLDNMYYCIDHQWLTNEQWEKVEKDFDTIKQVLLKPQKEHKALEIIKEKKVDMWHLVDLLEQTYEMYLAFCKSEKYEEDYVLTEEEFNTLKEVLGQ